MVEWSEQTREHEAAAKRVNEKREKHREENPLRKGEVVTMRLNGSGGMWLENAHTGKGFRLTYEPVMILLEEYPSGVCECLLNDTVVSVDRMRLVPL